MEGKRTFRQVLTDVLISSEYLGNMLNALESSAVFNEQARDCFGGLGEFCRESITEKLRWLDVPGPVLMLNVGISNGTDGEAMEGGSDDEQQ